MALALVATGSHPQPSAGHFCCTVGGCSCPLPDSGAASGPCTTANWQPICGPGSRRANSGQCRMIYLEAFSKGIVQEPPSTLVGCDGLLIFLCHEGKQA